MMNPTPENHDPDHLETTLAETLQTRWPARPITERQVQTLLAALETHNRTFTMQTRLTNTLRPVAFIGLLALLVFALSWIFGAMRPNPALENENTPTPNAFIASEENPLPAENPVPNATFTPTPAGNPTPEESPTSISHIVKPGETCASIATEYKISLETLLQVNALDSQCAIALDQILFIPLPVQEELPADGFVSMPNVTFSFANPFPPAPAQITLYQQHPEGELTEDAVQAMAAQMGVNGPVTTYPGEGGDTIYDVTDGNIRMIFYGFPDQFSYFTTTSDAPGDPLPFDQRVALAEEFLNTHSLLTYPYRAEPSETDPNGVRFVELLDGIPLIYGIGKNPGVIERINISISPDGKISSLFHSHHNYQPLETYPLLTAEQAWARLAQPNAESRARYAVLAPPMSWTRTGLEPTETLTGYLNNENGDTTFYADDGRAVTLLEIPADMPLYPSLQIHGTVTANGLNWSSMTLLDYGYGSSLSCGGGGGGGGGYTPDANFGGGNFAVTMLEPLTLPTPTKLTAPLQPGDVIDGLQGLLYIIRRAEADGTGTNQYNFWHMGDENNPGWSATLEGEALTGTERLQNLPIHIWGAVSRLDEYGNPIITVDRYEEAYPGTQIQAWIVTQQVVTLEGQEVVLLTAQDGSQFVSNQSITWGSVGSLAGNTGDNVIIEGYLVPNKTFGGYPVINELMGSTANGVTSLDDYIIHSSLIDIQDVSMTNPAATLTGHITIENIELMYTAVTLTQCSPDFINNPEYAHFLYAQPIWRFTGHFDDGRLFEIQIQALPDEYLR